MIVGLLIALVGSIIYRLRGWGPPPPERWWKARPILQAVFAAAYGAVAFHVSPLAALIVIAVTTGAVLTGHASYLDLGTSTRLPADGQTEEWYGRWIPGSGYWHDFAGLAVSGLLITAPCGVALIVGGYVWTGAAVLSSGALKAPAYSLSRLVPSSVWPDRTAVGECLAGAALWGSLALIVTVP